MPDSTPAADHRACDAERVTLTSDLPEPAVAPPPPGLPRL
jgi:hypothetical protein